MLDTFPPRPGEARNTLADYSEVHEKTGWKPKRDLEGYIKGWLKDEENK